MNNANSREKILICGHSGYLNDEAEKYRKKSSKKPPAKANHKHKYKQCYLEYDWVNPYSNHPEWEIAAGSYCSICGKIGEIHFLWSKDELEYDENAPHFFLKDLWKQKYVNLEEKYENP